MIFITYLGKMALCSAILLSYYWLFLRNRRFHHYNRFYLLGTLALSIVLPLFKIPIFNEDTGTLNQVVYQTARVVTLQPLSQQAALPAQQTASLFTFSNLLWVLYSAGVLVFMVMLGRSLWYIRKISNRYPYEVVENMKFYQTHEPGTPFSFLRSIFWNKELDFNSQQGQQVFRHELFHVQQKHSADILLAELIMVAVWFNPFFHLIKKELKAIHEFLADQYAASDSNRYQYAELLVQQVMTSRKLSVTHYFFQNQLKRRIVMITQLNQPQYGYWSRVMALPILVILFFSVSLHAQERKSHTVNTERAAADAASLNNQSLTDTIPKYGNLKVPLDFGPSTVQQQNAKPEDPLTPEDYDEIKRKGQEIVGEVLGLPVAKFRELIHKEGSELDVSLVTNWWVIEVEKRDVKYKTYAKKPDVQAAFARDLIEHSAEQRYLLIKKVNQMQRPDYKSRLPREVEELLLQEYAKALGQEESENLQQQIKNIKKIQP
ncbi:M56 family metallopeptidase [Pseudoflavitalea sp. X16]|uniref:M56 family metallopeptidase n=1 Tax=Paraflavitalea devenefica TaxID=2716334 RepID=UPI00141D8C8D|nr:M56 family metallopeptidase [Paraflavitalea devenefica]NII28134.1 M56 family metallopeptidase [Paraflavitalea devenefica]